MRFGSRRSRNAGSGDANHLSRRPNERHAAVPCVRWRSLQVTTLMRRRRSAMAIRLLALMIRGCAHCWSAGACACRAQQWVHFSLQSGRGGTLRPLANAVMTCTTLPCGQPRTTNAQAEAVWRSNSGCLAQHGASFPLLRSKLPKESLLTAMRGSDDFVDRTIFPLHSSEVADAQN